MIPTYTFGQQVCHIILPSTLFTIPNRRCVLFLYSLLYFAFIITYFAFIITLKLKGNNKVFANVQESMVTVVRELMSGAMLENSYLGSRLVSNHQAISVQ